MTKDLGSQNMGQYYVSPPHFHIIKLIFFLLMEKGMFYVVRIFLILSYKIQEYVEKKKTKMCIQVFLSAVHS